MQAERAAELRRAWGNKPCDHPKHHQGVLPRHSDGGLRVHDLWRDWLGQRLERETG
jgi:hypothetical protein